MRNFKFKSEMNTIKIKIFTKYDIQKWDVRKKNCQNACVDVRDAMIYIINRSTQEECLLVTQKWDIRLTIVWTVRWLITQKKGNYKQVTVL